MPGTRPALIAVALSAVLLSGCQAIRRMTTSSPPASPPPLTSLEGVAEAMRDTIAERLAAMEIERATMAATSRAQSPEIIALERRRVLLCRDLTELQRTISVEAHTTARALRAVEERLAGLAVERTLLLARRNAESPEVRALDRMILDLQARRLQLRAPRRGGELRACPSGVAS